MDRGPVVRVLLVADQCLIADGFVALLSAEPSLDVVGMASSVDQMTAAVASRHPEVVAISLWSNGVDTLSVISAARQVQADHPELGIVILAEQADGLALSSLRDGPRRLAFLIRDRIRDISAVTTAIHDVNAGRSVVDDVIITSLIRGNDGWVIDDFTPRELEVLRQVALGRSNRAIASTLGLSLKSVEKHITSIFRKLQFTDRPDIDRRVAAALLFRSMGLPDRSVTTSP